MLRKLVVMVVFLGALCASTYAQGLNTNASKND